MKELEDAEDAFALARLVEAVENQIADGQPREAGMVMMALLSAGEARQDALEQMAEVLAAHIAVVAELLVSEGYL
jgi:mannitol/fructose-specific phosphotransferase system IIA component (Ntr-type)